MSWWQLRDVLAEQAAYLDYYRQQVPVACPFDGTPLREGPASEPFVLFCPHGDFRYPDDWNPDTMSGM